VFNPLPPSLLWFFVGFWVTLVVVVPACFQVDSGASGSSFVGLLALCRLASVSPPRRRFCSLPAFRFVCLFLCSFCFSVCCIVRTVFFVVFCFVLLSAGSDLPFYVHRFLGVVSDTTASLAVVVVVLYILFFMYCLFLCFCSYQRLGGCIWFR
jgi:hypothetical protein